MDSYDQKYRWGGLLECPLISRIQRNLLDPGRNKGLAQSLSSCRFDSVIDVGCGLGETSEIISCRYCGVDNSPERIAYAGKRYSQHSFLVGDARGLAVPDASYDAAMLIDVSHHLSDEMFRQVVIEMTRVSRRYVIVSDPVFFEGQGPLSRFFYALDRGSCFRTQEQMTSILGTVPGLAVEKKDFFTAFPNLYRHIVICLRKIQD